MAVTYKFKNIGPIKEAEMELGDLTIIAGANNTGKTYLAYALYGFLRLMEAHMSNIQNNFYPHTYAPDMDFLLEQPIYEAMEDLVIMEDKLDERVFCEIDLDFLMSELDPKINYHADVFVSHMISDFFSARPERFENTHMSCQVNSIKEVIHMLDCISIVQEWSITNDNILKITITDVYEKEGVDYYAEVTFVNEEEKKHYFYKHVIANVFVKLLFHVSPFILSSERFGISLFYKELDFTKNRIVEHLQSLQNKKRSEEESDFLDKHSSRYAKPIKDNIDFTRDLEDIQKKRGKLAENKLNDSIKEMLGGYYRYAENEIRFISKKRKEGVFNLPLYLASSSARGFSDLYFYLQHVAEKGQLLIIDEPESHLDTKNQIKLARLLARIVNAGVKVLVTTHSDYLIKELNNLIMLSAEFDRKDDFLKKYKKHYSKDDYIEKERVRGYICEKGTLTKCKVDSRGVLMPNFDATIEDINWFANTLHLMLGDQDDG